MQISKPLTFVTLLFVGAAVVQADTKVTSETLDHEPEDKSGKPADPKFVCTVQDHTCRKADDFIGIRNKGFLHLDTCYTHGPVDGRLSWGFNGFKHYNNFWVACENKDPDCEKYVQENINDLDKVAEDLRQSIKDHGDCNPKIKCFKLEDADEKCFQK